MLFHDAVQSALEYAGRRNYCNEGDQFADLSSAVYHDRELQRAIDEAFAAAFERQRQAGEPMAAAEFATQTVMECPACFGRWLDGDPPAHVTGCPREADI